MKIIFTLLFITSLSIFSFSQTKTTAFYCGLNISKWTGDANQFAKDLGTIMNLEEGLSEFKFTNESRLGFTIGLNMEFPISGNVSFQPGVFYSQKGTVFNGGGKVENISIEEKSTMICDHIDLPLLFKLNLSGGNNNLYLLGGPALGYLINSKIKITTKESGKSNTITEELKDCKF